jgi:hypothetical protein
MIRNRIMNLIASKGFISSIDLIQVAKEIDGKK